MTPADALAGALGPLLEIPGRLAELDARLAAFEIRLARIDEAVRARSASASTTDLLTTAEAATIARVRPATVRDWIRDGRLPASSPPGSRLRLVCRADLLAFLRGGEGRSERADLDALADKIVRPH